MKYKAKRLAERFVAVLSQWPGVECVSLNEAALPDTLDPYFALIMDVFYRDGIPGPEERRRLFGGDILAFETSAQGNKDRFLVGDMPVRLEFKDIARADELVSFLDAKRSSLWLIKDSGTYGFYRLAQGELLFNRSQWIDGIRRRLSAPDEGFWLKVRDSSQSKMEHFLSDLGAAMLQEDDFYYLMSSSGFIKYACLTLFCINKRFEPSHRGYYKQVAELPILPESFPVRLETFLRPGSEPAERKYALAQLMARGIVAL
ncbi:MAG: DUF4037 domain-containing protein [Treponema sp.]|jgi:hypothetical protein|nr:DUF4037 domain-containing protein [Treponema sp.]